MHACKECMGLPRWLEVKDPPANGGDTGLIPGSGRFPGGGNCKPFQYSSLENPMDRGAWWATVHGVTELDMSEHACRQEVYEDFYGSVSSQHQKLTDFQVSFCKFGRYEIVSHWFVFLWSLMKLRIFSHAFLAINALPSKILLLFSH